MFDVIQKEKKLSKYHNSWLKKGLNIFLVFQLLVEI